MMGFKHVPTDNLYNRRLLAVIGVGYMVVWLIVMLVCRIKYPEITTSDVTIFITAAAGITGGPLFAYLLAANKADRSAIVKSITQKTDGQETSVVTTEEKGADFGN
jgi:hypothetical protein